MLLFGCGICSLRNDVYILSRQTIRAHNSSISWLFLEFFALKLRPLVTDRVSMVDKSPTVRPFVSTLSFEPTDLLT